MIEAIIIRAISFCMHCWRDNRHLVAVNGVGPVKMLHLCQEKKGDQRPAAN